MCGRKVRKYACDGGIQNATEAEATTWKPGNKLPCECGGIDSIELGQARETGEKTKKPHGSTPPNDATVSPTVQHLDASKRKCSGQTTLNVATAWADYWIRQQ
jgi:hypothetical protein